MCRPTAIGCLKAIGAEQGALQIDFVEMARAHALKLEDKEKDLQAALVHARREVDAVITLHMLPRLRHRYGTLKIFD